MLNDYVNWIYRLINQFSILFIFIQILVLVATLYVFVKRLIYTLFCLPKCYLFKINIRNGRFQFNFCWRLKIYVKCFAISVQRSRNVDFNFSYQRTVGFMCVNISSINLPHLRTFKLSYRLCRFSIIYGNTLV